MTAHLDDPFGLPQAPRRTPIAWLTIAVVLAVLAVVAFWAVRQFTTSCGGLRSGLSIVDGECVGVSGTFAFEDEYEDVMRQIRAANEAIGDDPSFTVAVLGSFTTDGTSPILAERQRGQLLGAHVAQQRYNQGRNADSRRMKLVVANWGSHQLQWEPVVADLVGRAGDEKSPLVAVTGLGASLTQTRDAAKTLSAARIPMVGTITTADELTAIDGFYRVSPPNREYVKALKNYLADRPDLRSAVVVKDVSPAKNDIFTMNLADDFAGQFEDLIGGRLPIPFSGSQNPGGTSPTEFRAAATTLCEGKNPPDLVLYAGRSKDLDELVRALADRCRDRRLTIMTGGSDNLISAIGDLEPALRDAGITLVYASGTDPAGWLEGRDQPQGFASFLRFWKSLGHPDTELSSGSVMQGHDAVLVVTDAVAQIVQNGGAARIDAAQVAFDLMGLHDDQRVLGATGDLGFGERGAQTGDPVGKQVPVVSVPAAAATPAGPAYRTR
ncbi:hypothetical protein KIH74_23270 [Kineosporia sp. J2-2]|uniref:ABC-type branched-subunit amino acid transport system substrate-binding protein n=1 Tax=Kineosporia corallincola TaxID=2835133 RepID=A0ABS5TLA9_9ACTN|nr:hypothetical protein [Kineosporia corallincola]MBT0771882.1 hypothetical protein [Kineosporia corallincola]